MSSQGTNSKLIVTSAAWFKDAPKARRDDTSITESIFCCFTCIFEYLLYKAIFCAANCTERGILNSQLQFPSRPANLFCPMSWPYFAFCCKFPSGLTWIICNNFRNRHTSISPTFSLYPFILRCRIKILFVHI